MRILLLTDIPPCTNYTAGLVINKWCDFLLEEGHEIFFALIQDKSLKPLIPEDKIKCINFIKFQKPQEDWKVPTQDKFHKIKGFFRSLWNNNKIGFFELPTIADEISEYAQFNKCERIFISVQGQTITRVAGYLLRRTHLKYTIQMWDPLEWWLKENSFDFFTKSLNLFLLDRLILKAETFATMSWAMSVMYEKKLGVNCVTNIPGLSTQSITIKKFKKEQVFEIAFAGQLYSRDEFEVLVCALDKLKWKYGGKKIRLNLYGSFFPEEYHKRKNVSIKGYLKQDDLLEELNSADLLYCPYWFSKSFTKACQISFPSKLVSYLKTGKAILMHAPSYASPRIFLENFKASFICGSLDVEEMYNLLIQIIDDKNREKIGKTGYNLFRKYMTFEVMKKSFLVSLGLLDSKEIRESEKLKKLYY